MQGQLPVAAFRAGRLGLESSLDPRSRGPKQLFLRMAWAFQRSAANTEGPGGARGSEQVSAALPHERGFRCKPELPAAVEGSSRPTARMCRAQGPHGHRSSAPRPQPVSHGCLEVEGLCPGLDGWRGPWVE